MILYSLCLIYNPAITPYFGQVDVHKVPRGSVLVQVCLVLLDLPPHEVVDLEESLVRLRGGQEALQRGEERRDGEGRRGEALEHDVQNLDRLPRSRIKPIWDSIPGSVTFNQASF